MKVIHMEYRMATINDVQGIIKVCSDGYHVTYKDILPEKYITQIRERENDSSSKKT